MKYRLIEPITSATNERENVHETWNNVGPDVRRWYNRRLERERQPTTRHMGSPG